MLHRIRATRDSGFTLTELLITIVILGVLAGIVVFAVNAFTNDSEKVACQADKRNVQIAADAYRAKMGKYPDATASSAARIAQLVPDYLKAAPNSAKYTISLDTAGLATGTLTGGAAC